MPFCKDDKNINRKGRPKKGQTIAEAIRNRLDNPEESKKFIEHWFYLFYEKDSLMADTEIWNRKEGKVKDEVKVDMSIIDHIPLQDDPDLIDVDQEIKQIAAEIKALH